MSGTLVVAFGPEIYLLVPGEDRPLAVPGRPDSEGVVRPGAARAPNDLPEALWGALRRLDPVVPLSAGGRRLAGLLSERIGRPVSVASRADWRAARRRLPALDPDSERTYLKEVARAEIARALRSPDEVLITLAREEERLERAVGREERAAEAFLSVPGSPLAEYADRWTRARSDLKRHHALLVEAVEATARERVPNLSAVVGPRVAARLVSAAGGLVPLGRMRGPRLQLLGSRRRPSPDLGPKFGVLYRAERMEEVPEGRRGAFARSLAALAAIAVRADASTRRSISAGLLRRRDRRVEELRRRRS